ncbi:hypothetical protein F5Y10DRAFT_263821 [Nemania abortiva]|nr:hypothetical protein F5Y10DRAFT_263821 [Nemania abortiva]
MPEDIYTDNMSRGLTEAQRPDEQAIHYSNKVKSHCPTESLATHPSPIVISVTFSIPWLLLLFLQNPMRQILVREPGYSFTASTVYIQMQRYTDMTYKRNYIPSPKLSHQT